jgi:hypothetical protein
MTQQKVCIHEWYSTTLEYGDVLVWCFKCGQNNTKDTEEEY